MPNKNTKNKTTVISIASRQFKKGSRYSTEEIQDILGSVGQYMQVVVTSAENGILCVRFQTSQNKNWYSDRELWILNSKRRIADAKHWITSDLPVPVFCSHGIQNNWEYLGNATATTAYTGVRAIERSGNKNVGLVLKMDFQEAAVINIAPKSTILRKKAA